MKESMASLETIFLAAREIPDAAGRTAYLNRTCGQDVGLRKRIETMLRAAEGAEAFFGSMDGLAQPCAPPLMERPGMVIGRYKLREKIGEGGCGVVYVAEQEEPVRRRVALKVIKVGMDTKNVLARFDAERQALAMMDHPNIAKVLDGGATETGRPYFVMELVRGTKITHYCDQDELRAEQRLELFIKICHAVQHAHQKGIIHRDLKPSNILVTLNDGIAVPKIIDFGIVKATEGRLTDLTVYTELHQLIGTPAYMSPEQALMTSVDIDTRSDIYSLGVLLYELLVGQTPFDPKELAQAGLDELRRTIREKEPLRPSTRLGTLGQVELDTAARARGTEAPRLRSLLKGDLDWIIMKCLEKDRARRYATAKGLADDIQRHLDNEPVLARPPSQLYRFQRLARRNRMAFAATAAVTAVLFLGGIVSTWQAVRATRAERDQRRLHESEARQRKDAQAQAYAAHMNLAQRLLELNNLDSALRLLNLHKPTNSAASASSTSASTPRSAGTQPSQIDLRGWEWRYLWGQCQSDAQSVFCQTVDRITKLAVSHDGAWLAIGVSGHGVSVRDLVTRQEIASLPAEGAMVWVACSPRESLVAYSTETSLGPTNHQSSIRLWNGVTRQLVTNFAIGGVCLGLAFSGDGQTLVALSGEAPDNKLTLWRVADRKILVQYPVPQTGPATPFAVARDLSVAAYATEQDQVCVIDLATGGERWKAKAADDLVLSVALSPDGKLLASGEGYSQSIIHLWDVPSGAPIRDLEGARHGVWGLVFSPDGKSLISGSLDQTIRWWDVSQPAKARQKSPPLRGNTGGESFALLPDTTRLASAMNHSVQIWDTAASLRQKHQMRLPAQLDAWRFAPDSQSVVTIDLQGRVARWQGTAFQEMEPLLEIGKIDEALLSEDCRWLAAASVGRGIEIWDLNSRTHLGGFTPRAGLDPSTGREYTHSRSRVGPYTANSGPVILCQFLAQGSKLMIAHRNDNSLHEWDLKTWKETRNWPGAPGISSHAFSRDGRWCLSSISHPDTGSTGSLIDLTTGEQKVLNVGWYPDMCFSSDGKLFAGASWGRHARLWETATQREIATFQGFLMDVNSVAFSPDGGRLATGSQIGNEAIKLWDVESHQELLLLEAQASWFNSTAFSPDGNVLGSKSFRGQLYLWRAPSWAQIEAAEKAQTYY